MRASVTERDLAAMRCEIIDELHDEIASLSWQRMVLLASSLEYRAAYGQPMPIGEVDHYIPALEAALSCVGLLPHD